MRRRDQGLHDFVLDQLAGVRGVRSKAMFGGHGLYCEDRFFGLLFKGRLYFKVSPSTRPTYAARGMTPFRPTAKQTLASFYEVPVDVLEQADDLVVWARQAIAAAHPVASGPRRRARARGPSTRPSKP